MTRPRWMNLDWRAATWAGTALYVAFSLVYLFLGRLNDDEGWYLYASKLVFEGKIPYRDFAYTQMPLLPYIYGLPQVVLSPSILLGRATSVVFSLVNLLLSLSAAHKYAGERGAALAVWLLASFTYGIYFLSIVKTYALLSCAFTLTLCILSSALPDIWKYPIAVVPAFLAAMVRLSAVVFLVPVVLYSLIVASRSRITFAVVLALLGFLAAGASLWFYPHLDRVTWNVLTYHTMQWKDISAISKVARILAIRIPDMIQFFDVYLLILLPVALLVLCDKETRAAMRQYLSRHPPLVVVGIGLALFSGSHLATGGWHIEYLVPAVVSFLPLVAIVFHKVYDRQGSRAARVLLWGVLLTALLVVSVRHNVQHIGIPTRELTLDQIGEVSTFISSHSDPSDQVLALQALWTVIESNRSVLPGLTMSQFSYHDVSTAEAQRLGLVNGEILLEYIDKRAAQIVVLTDLDWQLFARTGHEQEIRRALVGRYDRALEKGPLGHGSGTVNVYLLRK